jgi:hypothetical protein
LSAWDNVLPTQAVFFRFMLTKVLLCWIFNFICLPSRASEGTCRDNWSRCCISCRSGQFPSWVRHDSCKHNINWNATKSWWNSYFKGFPTIMLFFSLLITMHLLEWKKG